MIRNRFRRHRWGVAAVTVAATAMYLVLEFTRYRTSQDGVYDLAIFDQAIRGYAHFHAPLSLVKGQELGLSGGASILGDHFSPILALLAPLYWIYDGPQTLLIAQALLLALAIVPLWIFTRRALGATAAYAIAVAYTVSWPIAQAVGFDFHEVAFAPLLSAILFERFQAGQRRHVLIATGLLLLVKEDMGLYVAGFGVALLLTRGWRRMGLGLLVGGFAATWVGSRLIIPMFGGSADFYWHYNALGRTVGAVAVHLVTHPVAALKRMITPGTKKLHTLKWLFLPLLLLPLASPLVLPGLVLVAERMLSDYPNWWGTHYHYNAFLIVPLLCAGVDTAQRLSGRVPVPRPALPRWVKLPSVGVAWAVLVAVIAIYTVPRFAFGRLLDSGFYRMSVRQLAAEAAVAIVPDGALVEASDHLGGALTGRTRVLLWKPGPAAAPWIVADLEHRDMGWRSPAPELKAISALRSSGYQTVFQRDGFVVLHKAPP
jgi:uncharacterized membrane protein